MSAEMEGMVRYIVQESENVQFFFLALRCRSGAFIFYIISVISFFPSTHTLSLSIKLFLFIHDIVSRQFR